MMNLCTKKVPVGRTICSCISRRLHGKGPFNSFSSEAGNLKKTCLHDLHVAKGGKMVPYAGWSMPVYYADQSHILSHIHTRKHVSVFDVTHMVQTHVYGADRIKFIESLTVGDIHGLHDNQAALTVFTNDMGGIQDDLIVTKTSLGYLFIVSNAGCAEKDITHMQTTAAAMRDQGLDVKVERSENGLIALQGPEMSRVLQPAVNFDLSSHYFMHSVMATVFGVPNCRVSRCGYTGEDGVEISVPADRTIEVVERLLASQDGSVKMAGLGARDSLRLEAGMCLYGNDIDERITPVEASLAWTIGKRRRETADFPGASIILQQLKDKPPVRRVGFVSTGPPVRSDVLIFDEGGATNIGSITSGCPSPILKKNISIGYVRREHAKVGTKVKLEVRKKMVDGVVVKMPFVPTPYYTGK